MKYDVITIGSGPSGAIASYLASKMGYNVLLLDKEKLPRKKLCGGGITHRTNEKLHEIGIDPLQVYLRKINKIKLCLNDSEEFLTSNVVGYTVEREDFDNFLVNRSSDEGTHVLDECNTKKIKEESNHVEVLTERGSFKSDFVLGADGIHSIVRKCIQADLPKNRLAFAVQTNVYLPAYEIDEKYPDYIVVDFSCNVIGFRWIFPKDNHLSVGCGCEAIDDKKATEFLKSYLKRNNYKETKIEGAYLPYSGPADKTCSDRTLLIGDASGFVNPITGGGIYSAIRSAELATETIDRAFNEKGSIGLYEKLWKREIGKEMSDFTLKLRKGIYNNKEKILEMSKKDRWFNSFLADIIAEKISPKDIISLENIPKLMSRPWLAKLLL